MVLTLNYCGLELNITYIEGAIKLLKSAGNRLDREDHIDFFEAIEGEIKLSKTGFFSHNESVVSDLLLLKLGLSNAIKDGTYSAVSGSQSLVISMTGDNKCNVTSTCTTTGNKIEVTLEKFVFHSFINSAIYSTSCLAEDLFCRVGLESKIGRAHV